MAVTDEIKDALTPDARETGGAEVQAAAYAPVLVNINILVADTEYAYQFPKETKEFTFHCRTAVAIRYSYDQGKVGFTVPQPPYFTLKASTAKSQGNLKLKGPLRIYFAAASAVVVEIESWR